jgi:hypothetical protein
MFVKFRMKGDKIDYRIIKTFLVKWVAIYSETQENANVKQQLFYEWSSKTEFASAVAVPIQLILLWKEKNSSWFYTIIRLLLGQ